MRSDVPWNLAFIALGSNIRPEYYLPQAARWIARLGRGARASTVWRSNPIGFRDQPNFLNAVVALETPHQAAPLRSYLRNIEHQLARRRDPFNKNAPRTIDLDIILFNDQIIRVGGAEIPDPEIVRRPFLAAPLAELAGRRKHPCLRATFGEIAMRLRGASPALIACRAMRLLGGDQPTLDR